MEKRGKGVRTDMERQKQGGWTRTGNTAEYKYNAVGKTEVGSINNVEDRRVLDRADQSKAG